MTTTALIQFAANVILKVALPALARWICRRIHAARQDRTNRILARRHCVHAETATPCPWTDYYATARPEYEALARQARADTAALEALLSDLDDMSLSFRQRRRVRKAVETDNRNHDLLDDDAFTWTAPPTVEFDF